MLVKQAYRYELKPNNEQRGLLVRHCGVARFAWNWALGRRKELFRTREGKERYTNAVNQHRELNVLKKTEFPWMYDVSKCAPQEALLDLDQAYANFYEYLKKIKKLKQAKGSKLKIRKVGLLKIRKVGLPKFKKKGKHDSFTLTGAIKVGENAIQLPRIGTISTKEPTSKFSGHILSATVSREADRWYCSLCVEVDRAEPMPVVGEIVGIDLGITCFATVSNGDKIDTIQSPKPLRKNIKKLRRYHRRLSRKQKGSQNRKKSQLKMARLYRRIRNIRKDFIAKESTKLAKTKSVICIEDLNVSGMMQNHHLARSIGDEGWGEFRRQLEYKCAWYGSKLVVIPRFYPSSKRCNRCGAINKGLELSERTWTCGVCGAVNERDPNAAHNVRECGIEILHTGSFPGIDACGVDVRPPTAGATHEETGIKLICYK